MSAKMLAKKLARKFNIPRSRRGSVLVLIVGVLAMIALLVLVYSTLGQADRRGAASLAARTKLTDQAGDVRDYFARVIADSTFNYSYQRTVLQSGGNYVDLRLRGAYDYPSTDPEFRSSLITSAAGALPSANEFNPRKFNPTGQVNGRWLANVATDPRMATGQPWLAASEPTWIRPPANDALTFTDSQFPSYESNGWAHISNFAPSGNFVNLYMLRPNQLQPGAGFNVRSGVPASNNDPRFSSMLTLRNPAINAELSSPLNPGGNWAQTRADGNPASLNRPHDWSTNQAGAFLTVEDNGSALIRPGQPGYIWNEWIDTDGDGRPDARPFEFVDVSNPNNPVSILALDPNYRWVFAARAIDLSGRVNVNTAIANFGTNPTNGNFDPNVLVPTQSYPFGLTPAEVSLRLMLESPWLYDGNIEANYSNLAPSKTAPDYAADYDTVSKARTIGGSAFSAAMFSRLYGVVPAPTDTLAPGELPPSGGNGAPDLRDIIEDIQGVGDVLTRRGLANAYKISLDPEGGTLTTKPRTVGGNARVPLGISAGGFFTLADQLELLTYNGANDDSVTSRLEQALDGRGSNSGTSLDFPGVGPLRSNRDRDSEIPTQKTFTQSDPSDVDRARQVLTQAYSDIRSRLTTISGARPIAARVFTTSLAADNAINKIDASDLRPDANELVARAIATRPEELGLAATDWAGLFQQRQDAANDLLIGYARALMPLIALPKSGDNTPWARGTSRSDDANRIQSYAFGPTMVPREGAPSTGPRGSEERNPLSTAEIALRRAAHMVLNLIASRDTDERGPINTDTESSPTTTRQRDKPKVVTDEIVGATLIFNENHLAQPLAAQVSDRAATQLNEETIRTSVYANETDAPSLFPFADVDGGGNTERREVVTAATATPAPRAFQRSQVFNLDYLVDRLGAASGLSRVLDTRALDPEKTARPVTLFAIKPQPFITSAVTMVSYSDIPDGAPGSTSDGEYDPDTGEYGFIKIDGEIDTNNGDFLFQMAIITLSNPFEVDIDLSSDLAVDANQNLEQNYKYYIEFGGRYYKILKRSTAESRDAEGRIVLRAKQSIDFFILSENVDEITQRLSRAGAVTKEQVRKLILRQLQNFNFDGATPSATDEVAFERFRLHASDLQNDNVLRPQRGRDVALMASQRTSLDEPFASMYGAGSGAKDLDRQVRLWRAYRSTPTQGVATLPRVDETVRNDTRNDILVDRLRDAVSLSSDPALTVRLEKTTDDDIDDATSGPEGQPGSANTGYTITLFGAIHRPRNSVAPAPGGPTDVFPIWAVESKTTLKRANGYRTRLNAPQNVAQIVLDANVGGEVDASQTTFNNASSSSAENFADWLKELGGAINEPGTRLVNTDPDSTIDFPTAGTAAFTTTLQFGFNRKQVESGTSRDGEQLPPIATTDMLTPLAFGPVHDPLRAADDKDLASGNRSREALTVPRHPENLEVQWTTLSEALALAVDIDSPERIDDPNYLAGNRIFGTLDNGRLPTRRFVPFHDLDGDGFFGQVAPGTASSDPHVGSGIPFGLDILNQFRTNSFGSTVLPVPGAINLNTASRNVVSTLPFAALDHDPRAQQFYGNSGDAFRARRDIASYLIAYRDKTRVFQPSSGEWIDMRNTRAGTADDIATGDDAGRRSVTGITGLREAPGFQSLAEVLAAQVGTDVLGNIVPGSGMSTSIASTMLGTASVRSDTFAVWFTMDGYREEDTLGLSPDDPLVPSIRKRYVMVVDRSNVVEKGQAPRILLFRELPTE